MSTINSFLMYFFLFYYNKMKDVISYYEEGGNSNTPADVGNEMKTQAKEWMKLLDTCFNIYVK